MQIYRLFITLLATIISTFSVSAFSVIKASPSNGKIGFASDQDGDYEIYVMNSDGSNVQQLTFNTGYDDQPVWSPDGSHILYDSDQDGDIAIFVMDDDGSNKTNLTPNLGSFGGRWSPDGTRIAYTAKSDSIGENIYVMNADGSQKENLTNDAVHINTMPVWSPDGNHIFIISNRNHPADTAIDVSSLDVYEMNIDGSNQTLLFGAGIGVTDISLSPDGTKIVYSEWRLGPTLIVRDLNTNQEKILVDGIQSGGADPDWSPDGTKIVFISDGFSIVSMDANGDNQISLLTVASPIGVSHPNWQPIISDLQTST